MKNIIETLVYCLLMVGFILLMGLITEQGLKRHEFMECQEWQKQSKIYQGWYSTEWQKDQCLTYGIELE